MKCSLIDEYVKKQSAHGTSTFNGSNVLGKKQVVQEPMGKKPHFILSEMFPCCSNLKGYCLSNWIWYIKSAAQGQSRVNDFCFFAQSWSQKLWI